jgi:diketogulonate reductase-like aldo/keto reductase
MSNRDKITRRKASKYLSLGSAALFIPPNIRKPSQGQMNKRRIPSTGEQLPVVGLGTWQTFDVGDSEQERAPLREVLKTLVDNGGAVIDSSPMYGRSEDVVGELTSEMKSKNSFFEATKVWTSGQEKGINQMQRSMDLMKVQKMDLM